MKKISFLLVLLGIYVCSCSNIYAQSGIITTIAGNGVSGYSGDGGHATNAELYPTGVAVDSNGDVYISSHFYNCVRKVNSSGIITTVAGNSISGYSGDGGQATAAELNGPARMYVDSSGNLYITDIQNNRIRKVNSFGIINTVAGNGTAGFSGDGGQATDAELNNPDGVVVDGSGNLYISDWNNNRIRKVTTSGIISTFAGNGIAGYTGDGGQATAAKLNLPNGLAIDNYGNLYIADGGNSAIRKVNVYGIIYTIAGNGTFGYSGDGGLATNAQLWNSCSVAKYNNGNIYIADDINNRIRKVDSSGVITTIAGNGFAGYFGDGSPAIAAELNLPIEIVVDRFGNMYISDNRNNRVRKVQGALGIENNLLSDIEVIIYPNPATETLTIKINGGSYGSFAISNVLGITMLRGEINNEITKVDIRTLPAGMYDLTLTLSKGEGVVVRKFLKE